MFDPPDFLRANLSFFRRNHVGKMYSNKTKQTTMWFEMELICTEKIFSDLYLQTLAVSF